MSEVLGNLLSNAFKFTERGGTVELTVAARRIRWRCACATRAPGSRRRMSRSFSRSSFKRTIRRPRQRRDRPRSRHREEHRERARRVDQRGEQSGIGYDIRHLASHQGKWRPSPRVGLAVRHGTQHAAARGAPAGAVGVVNVRRLTAGLLVLASCHHRRPAAPAPAAATVAVPSPPPEPPWARTAAAVQAAVDSGQFSTADSILAAFELVERDTPDASESAFWRAMLRADPRNPAFEPGRGSPRHRGVSRRAESAASDGGRRDAENAGALRLAARRAGRTTIRRGSSRSRAG
jgi:hypothetical protein